MLVALRSLGLGETLGVPIIVQRGKTHMNGRYIFLLKVAANFCGHSSAMSYTAVLLCGFCPTKQSY